MDVGRSSTPERVRLALYLSRDVLAAAKAAYLADGLNDRGEADTFAAWVAESIQKHAAKSPAQRATDRESLGPQEGERTSQAFAIPSEAVERMREAVVADQRNDWFASDSAWCSEALIVATAAAREANGGTLPSLPKRLPNRLRR